MEAEGMLRGRATETVATSGLLNTQEASTCFSWFRAQDVAEASSVVLSSLHSKVADIDVYHFVANHQLQDLLAYFSRQREQW